MCDLNPLQILGNTWSLLAAGISSAVVGASFIPQIKRMDQVVVKLDMCVRNTFFKASERIYRGVVAKPHSWPWIAKLKVTLSLMIMFVFLVVSLISVLMLMAAMVLDFFTFVMTWQCSFQ